MRETRKSGFKIFIRKFLKILQYFFIALFVCIALTVITTVFSEFFNRRNQTITIHIPVDKDTIEVNLDNNYKMLLIKDK